MLFLHSQLKGLVNPLDHDYSFSLETDEAKVHVSFVRNVLGKELPGEIKRSVNSELKPTEKNSGTQYCSTTYNLETVNNSDSEEAPPRIKTQTDTSPIGSQPSKILSIDSYIGDSSLETKIEVEHL